ncbi:hypothetical protein FAES_pFAES01005 (plasmid) [Fibrella aestuarina BUZ 2]|uniref:Uncharacterized protein n=1 Tax=Fibrella aestuarina BUZ 2 TaxID=1166018 RepID=I0KH96_9BACT|nr:hypothetical protein FAES_pFAES01005 [Fibrella aestuarina BUZ 2]
MQENRFEYATGYGLTNLTTVRKPQRKPVEEMA